MDAHFSNPLPMLLQTYVKVTRGAQGVDTLGPGHTRWRFSGRAVHLKIVATSMSLYPPKVAKRPRSSNFTQIQVATRVEGKVQKWVGVVEIYRLFEYNSASREPGQKLRRCVKS